MTKKVKLIILFLGFLGVMLAANFVLAADFGISQVNTGLAGSLSSTDPRLLIGRIIQVSLGFLGAIVVVIIMYAGFLWMTSDGEEEKITQAKGILKNAIIGLIIILSSFGIATYILAQLSAATGGTGGNVGTGNGGGGLDTGAGAIGACTVVSTYPASGQQDVPRNTSIIITFREKVKLDSVCIDSIAKTACVCGVTATCNQINPAAVRIYKTDLGDACTSNPCPAGSTNEKNAIVGVSTDNRTLVLSPSNYLGSPDGNTPYSIKFTNLIKRASDGVSMFKTCQSDFAAWNFTVSNKIDLTPPVVAPSSMSPFPDNLQDTPLSITPAQVAAGAVTVKALPQVYEAAKIDTITASDTTPVATAVLDYHGSVTKFEVQVTNAAPNKAQLFDVDNNPLGIADFDSNGRAVFDGFMTLTAVSHPVGSLWDIRISPEKLADNLTINSTVYTFATSSENNNILVLPGYTTETVASNTVAKISGEPSINATRSGSVINLTAKVGGKSGNDIAVTTTNSEVIEIIPLKGGTDRSEVKKYLEQPDRPMNTVIQVNFNEAVNPLQVSGSADEASSSIKVVNASPTSKLGGDVCSVNSDCRSYKCDSGFCVGDYLAGNFVISNGYKTVEFISDHECGINGCGEKIYCLPANSHLAVKLKSADLKICAASSDCLTNGPFSTCASTSPILGYSTCQNSIGENYPTADLSKLNGVVDASLNSLDGDRSGAADGPIDFYNDNYQASSTENINKKDKYEWSFFVSDKLNLDPPVIKEINPIQAEKALSLADPVNITFDKVMMNSTLTTGSSVVNNGTATVEHHLININSVSPSPLGYWILADNQDVSPLDGFPDITVARIFHSPFIEAATYKTQVGSGVKDIYQNCYKPSAYIPAVGPACGTTEEKPSCCFGQATSTLGSNGNCQ
ncbi:MAG: Ig-like domain-containing protein [Patescibacteria group bacterium]|jgi:hypothetical protein